MKAQDLVYIRDIVEDEGFAYAFLHYSDFGEVDDEEFHNLRLKFENAAEELAEYLGVSV